MAHRRIDAVIPRRALVLAAAGAAFAPGVRATRGPAVEVWKDPSCGCCKEWVQHLEENGFEPTVHDTGNNAARTRLGVDRKYGSCHTALIGGYAVEGHVPARDIKRLLVQRPQALGLAVPGMPVGSPGMDGATYKGRKDAFDVLLLSRSGSATVYQHYEGRKP